MRTVITILAFVIAYLPAQSQNNAIDRFFSAYENNENFTVVFVSPKMFEMVAKATNDSKNSDIKELVKDIRGLKILSTKKDPLKK